MRTMFEHLLSTVVMVFIVFLLTGIASLEVQSLNARKYHAAIIENIQDSHYRLILNDSGQVDLARIDVPDIYELKVEELGDGVNSRHSFLVELDYSLQMPLFGFVKSGSIVGYAR